MDTLSDLSDAERAQRKKALAVINGFLDEVDKANTRLGELADAAQNGSERVRPAKAAKRKAAATDAAAEKGK